MRGIALAMVVFGFACSSAPEGEDAPPTLEVFTPDRGTTSEGHDVTVTGRVTDDKSGVKVTVNGIAATVAKDGTFTAPLTVDDGVSIIETHAIDSSDQDVRDVRAIMAGTLSPTDGTASNTIAARVGTTGFTKLGNMLAGLAQALDWKSLALAMNPVYDSSGCNSAKIDIQDLTVGAIAVALTPADGTLGIHVSIDNVYVKMHADFRAVCISGSTTVEVRSTRAHVKGDLAVSTAGGTLSATLPTSTVTLDGFSLDINNVPGAIESLIKDEARKAAEKALNKAVQDQVPAQASEALGGLLAEPISTDLLGHATQFTMTPTAVTLTPDGLTVGVDTKLHVTGGEGGLFVSSPSTLTPTVWQSTDLGIALDDDLLNQLFSSLWATGALSQALSLDGDASILTALLDDDAKSIDLEMKLPPAVRASNGVLELAIGDLILHVKDASNTEIQTFALTIITSLSAAPSSTGQIAVTLGTPTIKAQVLAQTEVVDRPLTSSQLEGIVSGAWGLVGGLVGDALVGLPLPTVNGLSLGGPSLAGREGFLVVDVPIQ
jgi:hypothetical protein